MRSLIRPNWFRQMPAPAPVDRSNDLGARLLSSAFNSARDWMTPGYDYVTGRFGTRGGGTLVGGELGITNAYNGTSSDFSTIPMDLSDYAKVTVSFWLWWDAYGTNSRLPVFYASPAASKTGFYMDGNSATGNFLAGVFKSNTFSQYTFARPGAGVWHHYAVHIDLALAASLVAVYVDGFTTTISANLNNKTAGGTFTAADTCYFMHNPSSAPNTFSAGRMMNFCVHKGLLTSTEIVRLMQNPYQQFCSQEGLSLLPDGARVLDASRYFLAC